MDGDRFDRFAQRMAAGHSRRSIVKGLAAVGLGALGLGGGGAAAAPRCKGTGTRCSKGAQCCSGNCANGSCCAPTTCAAQGKNCGTVSDGCGGTLTCGTCAGPQTCGGGGAPNVCGCTPTTCAAQGATCGSIPDGCGGPPLDCGSCGTCQICSDHTCVADCACTGCPAFQTCSGGACVDPCSLGTCADCGTNYCAALPGGDAICVISASTLCGTECVSDSDCLVNSPFTTCLSSPSICGKATGSCSVVSSDRTCG